MSEEVSIGRKFSVVIPKSIRRRLQLREGQKALVALEGERIVIEPLPEDPDAVFDKILGDFSYSEDQHEKATEEWLKRIARPRH